MAFGHSPMLPTPAKFPRTLSISFLLGLLSPLTGCIEIPGPDATADQIAGLKTIRYQGNQQGMGALRSINSKGTPVIYVHGSPGSAESWADFLVEPIEGSIGIAIDRPGYGRSNHGAVLSLDEQARAIGPLLESSNGVWPILVGHSLGGPIVAQAAAHYPNRVGGIVIVAGAVDPGCERLRWFNYVGKVVAWLLPMALYRSNQEMWDLQTELRRLEPCLAKITCPVAILHGQDDGLVPFENAAFIAESVPNASRVEVFAFAEGNHFLPWEEPFEASLRNVIREMVLSQEPGFR